MPGRAGKQKGKTCEQLPGSLEGKVSGGGDHRGEGEIH